MTSKKSLCILFFFILQALTGCTTPHRARSPLPMLSPQSSLETIVNAVNSTAQSLTGLRASGTLTIQNNAAAATNTCSCLVVIKNPDKIMIKGYSPLIPNYFTLIITGDTFWYYIPHRDIVFTGPITALTKESGYDITLHPRYIKYPFIPPLLSAPACTLGKRTATTTTLYERFSQEPTSAIKNTYQIDNEYAYPSHRTAYLKSGIVDIIITYGELIRSGTLTYPRRITFFSEKEGTTISFSLTNLLFNPEIADSIFTMVIPEGVTQERIGAKTKSA